MSKKKLYVVEDDNRLHLAFNDAGKPMWFQTGGNFTATDSVASMWSLKHGGHVVTLVEEREKVVLTKEQAEIVDAAHNSKRPASYIILKSNEEELLMNAYVNGYTVEKDKKYNVKVPHTRFYYWKWKADEPGIDALTSDNKKNERYRFTEAEIEHYGLQDCERVEIKQEGEK